MIATMKNDTNRDVRAIIEDLITSNNLELEEFKQTVEPEKEKVLPEQSSRYQ